MKTTFIYCLLTLFIEMYAQLIPLFQRRKTSKTDSLKYGEFRNVILKKKQMIKQTKQNKLIERDNRWWLPEGRGGGRRVKWVNGVNVW